jgi:hypothetical protein
MTRIDDDASVIAVCRACGGERDGTPRTIEEQIDVDRTRVRPCPGCTDIERDHEGEYMSARRVCPDCEVCGFGIARGDWRVDPDGLCYVCDHCARSVSLLIGPRGQLVSTLLAWLQSRAHRQWWDVREDVRRVLSLRLPGLSGERDGITMSDGTRVERGDPWVAADAADSKGAP